MCRARRDEGAPPHRGLRSAAGLVLTFVLTTGVAMAQERGTTTLIDFSEAAAAAAWTSVNDGVMGGVSSGRMRHSDSGSALFEGTVSLENNGGFASVRTRLSEGVLSRASKLVLRVRGDGKRYQLRLRMGPRFDGVAYAADFETESGEWTTVSVPLGSLAPIFRGDPVPDARPLDPDKVRQLGIMLTDKQTGPFRLEIERIDVVSSTTASGASD